MKKIIILCFALAAIFCSASAQSVTMDSFYGRAPQNLIELTDSHNVKYGIMLVYSTDSNVTMFFLPDDKKDIRKHSREEKKLVMMMLAAYWQYISKQPVRLVEKGYKDKRLHHLVLTKN